MSHGHPSGFFSDVSCRCLQSSVCSSKLEEAAGVQLLRTQTCVIYQNQFCFCSVCSSPSLLFLLCAPLAWRHLQALFFCSSGGSEKKKVTFCPPLESSAFYKGSFNLSARVQLRLQATNELLLYLFQHSCSLCN